jgi:type IV secretory pathway VirB2 component (pilin)
MPTIARLLTVLTGLLLSAATFAQDQRQSWLVETMYKSGKINTVIAVVSVVLVGIATWLFLMDRKLSRIEKQINHQKIR